MDNKLVISFFFAAICILIMLIFKHFSNDEELPAKDKKRLFYLVLVCGLLSGLAIIAQTFISEYLTLLFNLALPMLIISLAYASRKRRKSYNKEEQA